MIKKRPNAYYNLCFNTRRATMATSTCTIPLDKPTQHVEAPPNDHKSLCFSLADQLLCRGLLSSARQVIRKIIASSQTIPDAMSTVDFAVGRGMELDIGIYGELIRKFFHSGHPALAHAVYCDHVISKGIEPDSNVVNSMVICLVKLGKLDEALVLFDGLLANGKGSGCKPGWAACHAVLRMLCKQERFLEAIEYFVRISNAKVKVNVWIYNDVIDGLCKKGCLVDAMKVIDVMRERTEFFPSLHSYKSLFYGFCRIGCPVDAESIIGKMEAQGFLIDRRMYTMLMNAYGKDKEMKMAMRVYFRMLKLGCEPDVYTYNTLIHGFCRMGLFDKGLVICNQMNEAGLHPDVVTYHVMISNYCKNGKTDRAMDLLNIMVRSNLAPSLQSYTSLVANLYKQNRHKEAAELCMNMVERGVVPDHVLYFTLLKNSQKGNELILCQRMLQVIAKNGCGLDPSLLSASSQVDSNMELEKNIEFLFHEIARIDLNLANVAGAICISSFCESRKTDGAFAFLVKMFSVGCNRPLHFAFNSLIKRLSQDGHYEEVMSLIDIMQGCGLGPNSVTYLILIHEYCKLRDLVSAFKVLDHMEERRLKPTVAIYDCIIGCLGREKRVLDAENLFWRMLDDGEDPDDIVYMTMINAYSRNGRILKALELFEMMIQNAIRPYSHTYTVLISGLVKKNMIDTGCIYLERMWGDGFFPNVVLYTSLVKHFLRMGEMKFALRLVDSMVKNQIEADVAWHTAFISGVCRNIKGIKRGRFKADKASYWMREKLLYLLDQGYLFPRENKLRVSSYCPDIKCLALNILQEIAGSSFMPNLFLFTGIIAGLCWLNKIEDAYNQLELMLREGIRPNEVTFTILIDSHSRVCETDRAISLFNMMNVAGSPPDRITCKILLKGLCRVGRASDALSVLYTMHKRGFFPSKASYENLLKCFCANYSSIAAFQMFEEMIAYGYVPRTYCHSWLLRILCEEKKLTEAQVIFHSLAERGKLPGKTAMRLLVETSNRPGKGELSC